MNINAFCNVNNLNKVELSNEISKNNNYEHKSVVDNLNSTISNKDYTEFSIDYSDDDIHNILSNIMDSFDFVNNITDERTIVDCADEYGKILKSINSNANINDKTKETITKVLDNSFDNFADKRSKYLSERLSSFFNGAYMSKEYREKNGGIDFGIAGDKLIDKDKTENNISNMFTAAKFFYKNNLDGTKQLDKYLEGKFNKTENIDKLSYNDFKSLEKSGVFKWELEIYGSDKEKAAKMNESLESLKKAGASEILTNTFNKACNQNNDRNMRIGAFGKIRYSYEKRLEMIGVVIESNTQKLKELADNQKKIIEEHKKQIEKLKKDMLKLANLKMKMNINGQNKILEELEKSHAKQLEIIDKQKIEIEDQQGQLRKEFSEVGDSYKNFLKNPANEISEYIRDPKNFS